MQSVKNLFSADQIKRIESCIQEAEKNTSGEIRIHLEERCYGNPLNHAAYIFRKLKMHKTELRNGIIFYLAVKDRKFSIYGDEGIHKNVPEGFWDSVRDKMLERFKEEKFTDGLCCGIEMAGNELKKYFPLLSSDKNELSNEVTFGNQ